MVSKGKKIGANMWCSKALGKNVSSTTGQEQQNKVWRELVKKLEGIQPGVTAGLD